MISRYDPCPCGSGKQYYKCCLAKSIREDGLVPVTIELQDLFDKENERFKEIMGRNISNDDPIAPMTLRMSESEYKQGATEILNKIGVDPRIIYVFNKLRFVIVEGEEMYTDEQIELWHEAVEEYEDIEKNGEDLQTKLAYSTLEEVIKCLDKLKFLYALIIRKYANRSEGIDLAKQPKPNDYILFCLTRNLKSLKAISLLAINDFPEDAFNLTRTNFENYAEIVYAKYDEKNLIQQLEAENGIINGTHNRKGKKLINNRTGETVQLKNNYEKIILHPTFNKLDSKIYNSIYSLLSSFTHPDIITAIQYIDFDLGFTDLKENANINPIIIALFINFMIIHELIDLECFESSKSDLLKLNRELASILQLANDHIFKLSDEVKDRISETKENYS